MHWFALIHFPKIASFAFAAFPSFELHGYPLPVRIEVAGIYSVLV